MKIKEREEKRNYHADGKIVEEPITGIDLFSNNQQKVKDVFQDLDNDEEEEDYNILTDLVDYKNQMVSGQAVPNKVSLKSKSTKLTKGNLK